MPSSEPRRFRRLYWTLLAIAVGCGGGGETTPTSTTAPVNSPLVLTTITVTLSPSSLVVGQTAAASAAGFDQRGAAIATGSVTWTSSNTAVASVSATGTVLAIGAGTTTITATTHGVAGQAVLTVTASATSPPTTTTVTLTAAGQSAALLTSPNASVALPVTAGAQYLIAVVNTDATYTSREDFTLSGSLIASSSNRIGGGVAASPSTTQSENRSPALAVERQSLPRVADARRRMQNHLGILDDNRRIYAAFGNPRAVWARAAAAAGRTEPASAAIVPVIGAVNKVYVKNALSGACTSVETIGARTVAIGQHVIVLADTNLTKWPQAYRPDSSFYQTFANEYDQLTYPHILANIGDPLAYDSNLSGVGKITVTITPVLNNFASSTGGGSVVAFVNGCDFFPFAATGPDADLSNQTEMFYSWVPSSAGVDVSDWEKGIRATAAHETKHIVSYTDRILNNSPAFEEIWLEEGLAQESSEIWERNFNLATFRGNATFAQTVACEIDLGATDSCDPQNDKPRALVESHLPFFFAYLQTESTSHTEGLGLDTPANYGAGWTISRWATDQYASSGEGTFIKSLVDEPTATGLTNLSLHTGQSVPLLLVYWNLASAIFQTPTYTFSDVRATIPSFNFADIFKVGQTQLTCGGTPCGLFSDSGTPVFPIQPMTLASGAFSNVMTGIPGTSAVFYLLTAPAAGTERIQLLSSTGGPLSSSSGFRVAILRVK